MALIATLDRQARDGGSHVMLDLLQATHRFSSPEVERPATALVSRLWDQLAIEAAERRYRAGKKEVGHEPS